jgi:hypothetical protein
VFEAGVPGTERRRGRSHRRPNGNLCSRTGSENAPLAGELARHYTVYNYQRRGRGKSGNTLPYAVEREIEDIAALIAKAGGTP